VIDLKVPLFNCEVLGNGTLKYSVFKNSSFGKKVFSDNLKVIEGKNDINLSKYNLKSGRYSIRFELNDKNGNVVPLLQNIVFVVPGTWMTMSESDQKYYGDGKFEAVLYLNGVGENASRGFKYWILDNSKKICGQGNLNLKKQMPRERYIKEKIDSNCVAPTLVGFMYDGVDSNGVYNIVYTVGDISTIDSINENRDENRAQQKVNSGVDFLTNNKYVSIGILLLLVILFFLYSIWNHKRNTIKVLGVIILLGFGFLGTGSVANAVSFPSSDQDNIAFTVNLNKAKYGIGENVTFTLGFIYVRGPNIGSKPSGGVIKVKVDNGNFTEIVSASNNATSYNISLPPIRSSGIHTLNFESPGLCGSSFGFSWFNFARFGSDKCSFSVNVNIFSSPPPSFPQFYGLCIAGANNKYNLSSTDANNDKIYYEVDFDSNGKNIVRVPTAGYIAPYPNIGEIFYSGWQNTGNQKVRVRSTNTYNSSLGWKNYSVFCIPTCTLPVICDGVVPKTTISANPNLVVSGKPTTIKWNLKNIASCSIKGTNGENWNWGIVGSQTQKTTIPITQETVYTLSCIDFHGKTFTKTTKVRIVPKWQEF